MEEVERGAEVCIPARREARCFDGIRQGRCENVLLIASPSHPEGAPRGTVPHTTICARPKDLLSAFVEYVPAQRSSLTVWLARSFGRRHGSCQVKDCTAAPSG